MLLSVATAKYELPKFAGFTSTEDKFFFVVKYFWFSYNTIFLSSVNQLSLSHFMLVERQQFLEVGT